VVDALTAVGFLLIGWVSSAASTQSDPDFRFTPRDAIFVVLLALATVPYAWRRRWATPAFLVSLAAITMLWLLGYNAGALPLVLLVGGSFVAMARPDREVIACAAAACTCFALLWWGGGAPFDSREAVASVLALGAALALGRGAQLRVDLAEARARAAHEAAMRAASEERLHVSRELHDIVGHSLGIIAVQAGVGQHLIDTEPRRAAEALDNIARISRDALDEVREVVSTLRGGQPSYHPAPGLDDLPALVETARLAGIKVELTLPDDTATISRQTGMAVHRITREALTNVVRHARATATTVRVDHHDGVVDLTIRDNGSAGATATLTPHGTSHGFAGMRERAEALGGTVSAGPCDAGGFLVRATLPVDRQSR